MNEFINEMGKTEFLVCIWVYIRVLTCAGVCASLCVRPCLHNEMINLQGVTV